MFVDLKCVLRSRRPVSVNRSPLNMLRSYTLIADAPRELNAVVCSIRKLSSSLLANAQDIFDVAFPDKRLDRFLDKEGPFKSLHEQIGI